MCLGIDAYPAGLVLVVVRVADVSVVVKELERTLEATSPHIEDVRLLREQAQRCRDILSKLTELSAGEPFDRIPLSALLEEVVAPHRNFGIAIDVALPHDPAPNKDALRLHL